MENTHSNNQQELFYKIVGLKNKIQVLAGFVQNDFNMMLQDGTVTEDNIKENIVDMDKRFNKVINELNTLHEECRLTMSKYTQ